MNTSLLIRNDRVKIFHLNYLSFSAVLLIWVTRQLTAHQSESINKYFKYRNPRQFFGTNKCCFRYRQKYNPNIAFLIKEKNRTLLTALTEAKKHSEVKIQRRFTDCKDLASLQMIFFFHIKTVQESSSGRKIIRYVRCKEKHVTSCSVSVNQ